MTESSSQLPELGPSNRIGLLVALSKLGVIPSCDDREAIAAKIRRLRGQEDRAKLARRLIWMRAGRASAAGAAAALPGAVPGLGTAAQVGVSLASLTPEMWFILREIARLHYELAALFGHEVHEDERQEELVLAIGLTTGAVFPAREAEIAA